MQRYEHTNDYYNNKFTNFYRFQHIFWIDASNIETVEQSYKDISSQLSPDSQQKFSFDDVISRLERLNNEWLLLFDGADEVDKISKLLPFGSQGNIIYTSRNPGFKDLPKSQTCEIDRMHEREAITLLLKAARLEDSSELYADLARSIAEELGFLALAVDQAGA